MQDMNLIELAERFSGRDSDNACRTYLEGLRWPKGAICTRCEYDNVAPIHGRGQYRCRGCNYHFGVTAGTIFHDSHLPLWKWFVTTYLMTESKKSISALQIKRTISVSYKTAWYLCHRIRTAMDEASPALLTGTVEIDETYVGGKVRGKGRGYRGNKTIVAGAVQRYGAVRMEVIQQADRPLHGFVRRHTHPDAEAIYTDEHPAYLGIGDANTRHETVNHSAEEWVRGKVHTNTAESVWSLFDRSVIGAYHHISAKHMPRYLSEQEWRFNNRDNGNLFRDTMRKLLEPGNLEYRELTAPSV